MVVAGLLRAVPDLRTGPVWRLGLVTFCGFVVGRFLAGRAGLDPTGTVPSVALWLVSVGLAAGVLRVRGSRWTASGG